MSRKSKKTKTSISTHDWYNEHGTIIVNKVAKFYLSYFNAVHIRRDEFTSDNELLSTPLYTYDADKGIYAKADNYMIIQRDLESLIDDKAREKLTANKLREIYSTAQALAPIISLTKGNIIALQNGLYNVDTMERIEKSKDIVTTTYLPMVAYDPTNTSNKDLDSFLYNLFGDDAEILQYIYEIIGYGLADSLFMQKFFILVGSGGNGKSAFIELLKHFYGTSNVSHLTLHELDDNAKLVSIVDKLAILGDDISSKGITETSTLKKVVTGNGITVNPKYIAPYSITPSAILIVSANEIPTLYDTSEGMKERIAVIAFNKKIRGTKLADPHIIDKIIASGGLSTLFTRGIEGLKRIRKNRAFSTPKNMQELTEHYIENSDSVAVFLRELIDGELLYTHAFMTTFYIDNLYSQERALNIEALKFVPFKELYTLYNTWAKECNYKPISSDKFSKRLTNLGIPSETRKIKGILKRGRDLYSYAERKKKHSQK